MKMLVIASRILRQLKNDPKYVILTVFSPLVVMIFLKIFFKGLPPTIQPEQYVLPIAAFVVYFSSFLLCAMVLVQERTKGTLERLFLNGCNRFDIIGGYTVAYMVLASIMSIVVVSASIWLFDLSFTGAMIGRILGVMLMLALVSIMIGIFTSTFCRTESQLFPFIPLIVLLSIFLSGMLVDVAKLPAWSQWIAKITPLYYAVDALRKIMRDSWDHIKDDIGMLVICFIILLCASILTFKEVE